MSSHVSDRIIYDLPFENKLHVFMPYVYTCLCFYLIAEIKTSNRKDTIFRTKM